jgi:hypothetical protein
MTTSVTQYKTEALLEAVTGDDCQSAGGWSDMMDITGVSLLEIGVSSGLVPYR